MRRKLGEILLGGLFLLGGLLVMEVEDTEETIGFVFAVSGVLLSVVALADLFRPRKRKKQS